jgi:hypothetical protein
MRVGPILGLSQELLLMIGRCAMDESTRDVSRLSRTSKCMHELLSPLLWPSVKIRIPAIHEKLDTLQAVNQLKVKDAMRKSTAMLNTIARLSPRLAANVEEFHLHLDYFPYSDTYSNLRISSAWRVQVFEEWLRTATDMVSKLPNLKVFTVSASSTIPLAELLMYLSIMPSKCQHLRLIEMGYPTRMPWPATLATTHSNSLRRLYIEKILSEPNFNPERFPALETIVLDAVWTEKLVLDFQTAWIENQNHIGQ